MRNTFVKQIAIFLLGFSGNSKKYIFCLLASEFDFLTFQNKQIFSQIKSNQIIQKIICSQIKSHKIIQGRICSQIKQIKLSKKYL